MWFVEKEIVEDVFAFVVAAPGKPFLKVYLEDEGEVFEATIYHMHIQTRKLEMGQDWVFARYKVLEPERELIRGGLGKPISSLAFPYFSFQNRQTPLSSTLNSGKTELISPSSWLPLWRGQRLRMGRSYLLEFRKNLSSLRSLSYFNTPSSNS